MSQKIVNEFLESTFEKAFKLFEHYRYKYERTKKCSNNITILNDRKIKSQLKYKKKTWGGYQKIRSEHLGKK